MWVIVYPILSFWMIGEACKEIGVGWAKLLEQMFVASVATAVMAVCVVTTQFFIVGDDSLVRIIRMSLAVCFGGISYVAVIFFRDNLVSRDVREMAGIVFGLKEPLELGHLLLWCRGFWK